jgi:hypothetical protein
MPGLVKQFADGPALGDPLLGLLDTADEASRGYR